MNNSIIKSTKPAYRLFFLLVVTIIPNSLLFAQSGVDSLKNKLINISINDTNYINKCLDIAWEYMYTNTDSAEVYAQKSVDVSQRIKNELFETNSYNTLGVTSIVRGNYPQALITLNKALTIANRLINEQPENRAYVKRILATYTNIGNVYYYLGEYAKAIENYLKAIRFSEQIDHTAAKANCLSNIGASYKDLMDYDKALEYNYKSLNLAKQTGSSYWLSQSLNNLGIIYFSIPDYDSAKYYFAASMKIFQRDSNEFALIESYVNMGSIYRSLSSYDTALIYFNKALQISKKLSSPDGLINANYMIGELYDSTGQYAKAIAHFKKSIGLASETGTNRFVMLGNEALANVYSKTGNYKKAYNHFKQSTAIRDSIFSTEHDERIAELETEYQTREKEERIKLLLEQNMLEIAQSQNRQIIFVSIIIILVLLLVAIALAYRSYKHKQIAEKSLMKQRSEKKVLDAVINTEYEERKRFAEELHDAMGALLSTLKLYVNELGNSNNSEVEKNTLLNQSNLLLDEAVENARTIAHNIMPASIKDNGLEFSLRSIVDKINASGKIAINLTTIGVRKHYEPILELSVYRMLTEMINNTLKHANASMIDISLAEKTNQITINYNDNGKGFNYEKVIGESKGGLGLKNILNRIEMIGGAYTISSKEGNGFFATIVVDV